MEGDMIGYGLMVLGIGIPLAVAMARVGNGKHSRGIGNGEAGKILSSVARLEERSLQQAESIRSIHQQLESVISRLDKKR